MNSTNEIISEYKILNAIKNKAADNIGKTR